MNLTAITAAVAIAVGLSAGFGAAWKMQAANINELKAEYEQTRMDAERTAFRQSEINSANIITAQENSAARVRRNTAAAAGAVAAGSGLRYASDSAIRAAQDSEAACLASLAKHGAALNAVVGFAQRAATESDTWEASAIEHHMGWPQ